MHGIETPHLAEFVLGIAVLMIQAGVVKLLSLTGRRLAAMDSTDASRFSA